MKFKFKIQQYQTDAVISTTDVEEVVFVGDLREDADMATNEAVVEGHIPGVFD